MDVSKKQIFIPDTSVLLKWISADVIHQKEAISFRNDILEHKVQAYIPTYCYAEIANYLGRTFHRMVAQSFLSFFLLFGFEEIPVSITIASRAFLLMSKFKKVSFYDAYYHACAMHEGGTYLTADETYYRLAHRQGSILLLKDYR